MKYFYSTLKSCLTGFFMIGLFLLAGEKANSQTTLSAGDILFTGFDSTYLSSAGDAYSFVLLTDITNGTQISFTDRGYFGGSTWQGTGSTESSVTWTAGTDLSLGTQIYIKGLAASVYDPSGGTYTPNGTVVLSEGSSSNGLSLSNVGDQISAFQGGSGSVTGSGVTMIAGINYFYCTGGSVNSTAAWNSGGCANGPNSSQMPPGLTGGYSAYFTGAQTGTTSAQSGYFNCPGGSLTTAAEIRTAVMNSANWILSATTTTLPDACTFGGPEPCALTASISSQTNIACNGGSTGSLTVTASGGAANYKYTWSNGSTTTNTSSTTNTISALSAGTYSVTIEDANGCTATANATITQPTTPLTVGINSQTNVSCNGGSNGAASVTVNGGTGSYTYNWTPGNPTGDGTPSVTGLPAGTWTCTVTDANGCTASQSVTITESSSISLTPASQTDVACFGSATGAASVNVATGGAGGYTYNWTPGNPTGDGTTSVTGLTAGSWTCTVTDSNNCTASINFTITQSPPISLTPASQTNIACKDGATGAASVNATGGTGPYTYNWTPGNPTGDGTASATGLTAGTWTCTVTDSNNCTASINFTVTEPTTVLSASATTTDVTCNGGVNGSVDLTVTGGTAPYSYMWSNTATTQDITDLEAGTYNVTVTDANNCTTTASATVDEPAVLSASTTFTAVSCYGNTDGSIDLTVTGGTAPYTFAWSNSAVTEDITNLAAGTYDVTVTDANGCTTTASRIVFEPMELTASAVVDSNQTCGNTDGAATASAIGGSGSYTYLWSNGATTASISGVNAGTYNVTITDTNGCNDSASVTITSSGVVASAVVDENVSCNGGSNGGATATATGGTSPYTYLWSNGATTASIADVAAGTYTVTITDSNICSHTATVTITEPAALAVSSTTTPVSCNGGSDGTADVTVTGGTAPYSFSWSSGSTTEDQTGLIAGEHDFTVTDAKGCTTIAYVTVNEPAVLSASAVSTPPACNNGSNGTANVAVTGGNPPYTYAWSNGGTTENLYGLTPGTYSVTVTDNKGCTTTASTTVNNPPALTATGVATNVSCNGGNNGSIDLTVTNGSGLYDFAWSNGAFTEDLTGLSAGTYTVTVSDLIGCTTTASITITQPTVLNASAMVDANVSCNSGNDGEATASATGGTSPYNYLWSNGATTASIAGVPAGTYTVTVTDANGCTDTANVTITQPTALNASAITTNVSCNGGNNGTVDLTVVGGTPPYTFAWSNTATTEDMTGLEAGTYNVTVTDSKGCTATASATITEPTVLMASAVTTDVSCNGGSNGTLDLTVTGGTAPYTFAWSNTATTEDMTGLTAGTYDVTVTDAKGCTTTASATVNEPAALIASLTSQTNIACNGESTGSASITVNGGNPPYTYSWSNGATTATINDLAAGTYFVTVTDNKGCTASASATISEPTALIASASVDSNVSCNAGNDGAATASATGGQGSYSYLWSNGATTASIAGVTAGTYTVTITDTNGCTDTASVTITEPTEIVVTTSVLSQPSCNGDTSAGATASATGGTGPYSYYWNVNGYNVYTAGWIGSTAGTYTVTVTDASGCTATGEITITEPDAIDPGVTQINVSCFGGNNGQATATPTGGVGPYNYLWSNGATTATISGIVAGTYTITITDNNGCTGTDTVTITEPTELIASAVVDANISCNGASDGEATASATGGTGAYTYLWSNGATTASIAGVPAGIYTVTITDANSCTDTAMVTITEPAVLTASAVTTNVSCNGGSNGTVNLTVTGGTAPYTFAWSNTATTEDMTGLTAGTYNVTVTDANGCTTTASATVTEPTILMASAVTTAVSCNGGSNGTVDLTVTGGTAPYSFAWSNTATTEDMTGLTAGTYDVTVTDANGCTTTASATVTEPTVLTATAVTTAVSCNGGNNGTADLTVTGGTAPYTFVWSNAATTEDLTGLVAGTYNVTVTDANGCNATALVTVTEPTALMASAVTTAVSCNGGSNGTVDLTVTGGTAPYTYAWSNTATTEDLTGLAAGTYDVTVTDANGCTATASATVTEPTVLMASAVTTNVSCNAGSNGTVDLTVTGGTAPYTYAWSNTATTEDLTGLAAGTYDVTVTDANGCTTTASATVTEPTVLTASAVTTAVSCNGGSNGMADLTVTGGTAPYTFVWSNAATTEDMTGLAAGTYDVTVTDANGCTATASATVTEPTALAVTFTTDNVSCPGGNDGTATVTVTGGIAPYTYIWSNTATTASITGVTDGTYTVTVTDANGCVITDSVVVATTPDVTAPVADVATLTDIVNYCGVMSDEIPVPTATDNCAGLLIATTTDPLDYTEVGTYVITWTYDDGNGNTTTQTQNITVEESPLNAVTFDNETFTYDGTVHTIEVNNLPAGATVSYSTSPDTGLDNGAINAGAYTVTATVNPQPEAFNCESIVLTATITIDQAPQTITFDALPVKNLEADPDFQLDATASSGLEVYYTYTYTSPDPAADVSSEGWVDMLTSGEITITAHQDGNDNYLPAATVSQVLVIESSDASIFGMTVGDETYNTPPSEIYHLIDCGDDSDSVEVTIVTEVGATVNPGHTFTIQTPQPGIYSYVVTVTSQDGTSVETYTIVVERRFDFSDIVVQKFDNVLLVNNNSQNNGGYEFTDYEWYKNGVLVGTGQYFSEGNNQSDTLDPTAEYMVKVTTIDGDVLQTCLGQIQLQHASGARLYPNPVTYGQLVTVEADFPESELENMTIAVYNLNGALITEVQSSSRITQLQLPLQAATYIVVLKTPNNSKTFKVLVQ
ncbi:T9SS type A sorting domain-containing protein [Flavobacterium beibuense]|uniref:T9SS type A sorting domain-containing protein n=1 Tax=Flavobacterium beibuense TaxID=657326 RepID=UPI003A9145DB